MTPDFRALCAELVQAMTDDSAGCWHREHDVLTRARAALAEPEPEPPANLPAPKRVEGVGELVEKLKSMASYAAEACQFGDAYFLTRAADLLERQVPQPVPEGPADDDIEALHQAVFASRLHGPPPNTSCEVDLVRAALARWSQS